MFKEIERAEELGSGVRNLAGHDPLLQEEQIFRVTVSIPSFVSINGAVTLQVTEQVKRDELVLEYCRIPRTRGEIQLYVGMKHREHFRSEVLQPLLEKGLLLMTIPDKPKSSKQRYITKTGRSQATPLRRA